MTSRRAVQWIFVASLLGVAFSGVLTWREVVTGTATCAPDGAMLGYPACAYGLVLYGVIALLAGGALWVGHHEPPRRIHH